MIRKNRESSRETGRDQPKLENRGKEIDRQGEIRRGKLSQENTMSGNETQ